MRVHAKMGEPAEGICRFRMPNWEAPMQKDTVRWPSLRDKIEALIEKQSEGCWLWTRSRNLKGYGSVWWDGRQYLVHRQYLKELGRDVPDGMQIDHLCRVTNCANPDHLEVVTASVNNSRREPWTRTPLDACAKGHPFDGTNTYVNPSGNRSCRACHVRWSTEYRKRREERGY